MLRFADQQKNGTISGFIPRMVDAQKEIFAKLKHDKRVPKDHLHRINEVITRRTRYLFNGTLMPAGTKSNSVTENCSIPALFHVFF